ncbi:protein FAR1-RELATED SEQUENCE 5-like [Phragmites australis]|uniref:protein FAR1-RELATED SEQUENCE 5-like n=1 Tax=Phragmites australis TaxID=29695 RepID=UPI002D779581|nr:protein FAR1-RELATED SEQUENCE 5-like [Phragmites australis]
MAFEGIEAVEEFYKSYAHRVGFGVRVGQQKKLQNAVVRTKRFLCNREGFKEKGNENVDPSKKRHKMKSSRCGCQAHIFVRLCGDNTYKIDSWVEQHNHGLVSPDKLHLIRSNREVSERAKNTLYTCHKASIGTSQAYRLLQVSEGGFENVGCTKRDLQNYYRDLRYKIKNADAQMFVAQLARKQEVNPAFFYDFVVDDQGKLVHVFWADATSRKNYSHFGNILSFDSTYTTNQYNMIFAPFTGVNHHLQSVFFGAAFLANEQTDSYIWLFETFLRAMGGVAPRLIITDEAKSIANAIVAVLPSTVHRLCMWHIMEKVPEKVGPAVREDPEFWNRINLCVWGSETPAEFESQWSSIISEFGLEGNEWFANRFDIRESWIPAYFMDISLAGILRTTSRSESANSFFNRFIHRKLAFVEFWLRFDTALECQRQEELMADNTSIHTTPQLITPWAIEKQGSVVFTYAVFEQFQREVIAARDSCCVQGISHDDNVKVVSLRDGPTKVREVRYEKETMLADCSCKLFQSKGIPCRHIILVLRGENQNELPAYYIMKRWGKRCKRESIYDDQGNPLEEKPTDPLDAAMRKKISTVRNKFEDLIQMARHSIEGIEFLTSSVFNLEAPLQHMVPAIKQTRQEEYEAFIGCNIPTEVNIHPPNDINSRGRSKRIKRAKEMNQGVQRNKKKEANKRVARQCKTCKQVGFHDTRTCPSKEKQE